MQIYNKLMGLNNYLSVFRPM